MSNTISTNIQNIGRDEKRLDSARKFKSKSKLSICNEVPQVQHSRVDLIINLSVSITKVVCFLKSINIECVMIQFICLNMIAFQATDSK